MSSDVSLIAIDDLMAWVRDPRGPSNYLLLGERRVGKTTQCQEVYWRTREARAAAERLPIPMYFDLRKVQVPGDSARYKVPTLQEVVEDCLRYGYLSPDGRAPRYDDVLIAIDDGALVILDGLDSVLSRLDSRQGHEFLEQVMRVSVEFALRGSTASSPKLLLSCSTECWSNLGYQKCGSSFRVFELAEP